MTLEVFLKEHHLQLSLAASLYTTFSSFQYKKKIVYISCHVQSLNVYFVLLNKGKQFDL